MSATVLADNHKRRIYYTEIFMPYFVRFVIDGSTLKISF